MRLASNKAGILIITLAVSAAVATVAACVGDEPASTSPGTTSGEGGTTISCKTGDNSCANGTTCVDGFCCDRACAGQCEACDVSGHQGTCTTVSGAPHHAACTGDTSGSCAGSCDGKTAASCTYPTVACGPGGSCAAGVAQIPPACSNGTCAAATTQTCSLGCFEDSCLGVQQMSAGYYFGCAVLTDGKVRCWGKNDSGQIGQGLGDTTPLYATPKEVTGLTASAKMVGTTFGTACAVLVDGTVECWGSNDSGQLGFAVDSSAHASPVAIAGISGATFISTSTGGRFCAIIAGGQVMCWGDNEAGSLGTGTPSNPTLTNPTPTLVCAPGSTHLPCTPASGATFIAGGDNQTCGVFGGNVACWGQNNDGQIGEPVDPYDAAGPYPDHPFPITIAGLTGTSLTAGNGLSCAVSTAGAALCWGGNSGGQLGNGTTQQSMPTPASVCTTADCSKHLTGVTGVTTHDESTCAIAGGAVQCWGSNDEGQLGDGTVTSSQTFAASTSIAANGLQVASGGSTNYAVVTNGAERNIRCWGANFDHECGNDVDASTTEKVPVSPKW